MSRSEYQRLKESKTVSEQDIFQCQVCGLEIDKRHIFCDQHNTAFNKQIYEFFSELPIKPRGEKMFHLFELYLAAKLGYIDDRRFIMRSISGAGKSFLMDMIAFVELTHFPGSNVVIGSVSKDISVQHIERLRDWLRMSVFARYLERGSSYDSSASKSEIKLGKLGSSVKALPQSEKTQTGLHPDLLLIDEIGRMRKRSYQGSFFQMGRTTGVIEILCSTPFLDSEVMLEIWRSNNIRRIFLKPEDCWWLGSNFWKEIEDSDISTEMYEQLYQAKFRSLTNRVIPDDILLESMDRNEYNIRSKELIMGVDFGRSTDPSAIVILDSANGDVVFAKSFVLKEDWNIQFKRVRDLYRQYRPIRIVADSSSMGDVIIRTNLSDLAIEPISMQGGPNKRKVIDRLKFAFLHGKLNIVQEDFKELVNQLSLYIYLDPDHLQTGPVGKSHDDLVDALGLACIGLDVTSTDVYKDTTIWDIFDGVGNPYEDTDNNPEMDMWDVDVI